MLKVLIVEDNRAFRNIFSKNLRDHFPTLLVEEAENAEEALRKIEAVLPQLIFMDIHLKGMNSLQLIKRIRKDFPSVYIACLTGYDLPEYREAALQHGADNFFVKELVTGQEIEALLASLSAYQ